MPAVDLARFVEFNPTGANWMNMTHFHKKHVKSGDLGIKDIVFSGICPGIRSSRGHCSRQ